MVTHMTPDVETLLASLRCSGSRGRRDCAQCATFLVMHNVRPTGMAGYCDECVDVDDSTAVRFRDAPEPVATDQEIGRFVREHMGNDRWLAAYSGERRLTLQRVPAVSVPCIRIAPDPQP